MQLNKSSGLWKFICRWRSNDAHFRREFNRGEGNICSLTKALIGAVIWFSLAGFVSALIFLGSIVNIYSLWTTGEIMLPGNLSTIAGILLAVATGMSFVVGIGLLVFLLVLLVIGIIVLVKDGIVLPLHEKFQERNNIPGKAKEPGIIKTAWGAFKGKYCIKVDLL